MKTEYMKCCRRILYILVLCAVLTAGTAWAGEADGTLLVSLKNSAGLPQEAVSVEIFRVADGSGLLDDAFEAAGLTAEQLTTERYSRSSAEALLEHAGKLKLKGNTALTGSDGRAYFDGLEKGVYMVLCEDGQSVTFEPFLVSVPDVSGIMRVSADPKTEVTPDEEPEKPSDPEAENPEVENPEDSDVPGAPGTPEGTETDKNDAEKPKIPQTGFNYWIVWILLGSGIAMALSGIWCLRSERNGGRE